MAGSAFFADPKNPTDEELDALEPDFIGPTWCRDELGAWLLPKLTLGWQIASWCAQYLLAENSSEEERVPWRFTLEQLRFLLWWYAVDEHGRFIYRKGVLQRMKGWGKDPLLAVICTVEFVGPSRFSHFDEAGKPVGVCPAKTWVQVTAVNQSQTTNTMELLPGLWSEELKAEYGVKDGAEIIRARNGKSRLEAVTSSYRAIEGKRTTFTLLNETHHWVVGNKGIKMYETIDGNSTKMNSRYLAITNAYLPGEDSVAERMRYAWEKIQTGEAADIGFLYDSIEAHPATPLSVQALTIVLPKIRGDASWLVVDTIIQSVLDLTISQSRSRRMYLNQIVAEEDAIYGPEHVKAIETKDATLAPGDEVVLGFDGGKTDDGTALIALRLRDMTAFVLGYWQRPDDWPTGEDAPRWSVPREKVDSAVHEAFRLFKVKGFYADVALWESYISEWNDAYHEQLAVKAPGKDHISWDMRQSQKTSTLAHERLMTAVFTEKLRIAEDPLLRAHMLNARRRNNVHGVSFGKESPESPRKVDLYAALLLAHECATDLRARGKREKPRTGQGWFL